MHPIERLELREPARGPAFRDLAQDHHRSDPVRVRRRDPRQHVGPERIVLGRPRGPERRTSASRRECSTLLLRPRDRRPQSSADRPRSNSPASGRIGAACSAAPEGARSARRVPAVLPAHLEQRRMSMSTSRSSNRAQPMRCGRARRARGGRGGDKVIVVGAVEVLLSNRPDGRSYTRAGRVRLHAVADASADSLAGFVEREVERGAIVHSDAGTVIAARSWGWPPSCARGSAARR
jgi:hypothetical protein